MHRSAVPRYGVAVFFLLPIAASPAQTIEFDRDIRPILSDKCFRCHGPDDAERQTSMRLDRRDSALAPLDAGGHAIVPGDVASSELLTRITSDDAELRMPPAETGKAVSPAERARLEQWIREGASWNEHWSFIPPRRPMPPPVSPRIRQTCQVRNPIDRFVLARLEQEKLSPAPEADKTTLIRRVTQDLTGLPPTPTEVDTFLADGSPDAYERLVDRLLQSPRYGEHRARDWLDVARYGDTHGLHLDNERSIWPYRDWVIEAFNRNQPFDQFTIEQLAGDLLPEATDEQRVATGFHRCNVTTSEGGSIDEEYLVRYAVDRVETTATTWMGLTAGCAACHDHKFDPITQREFYQLVAYFFSLTERAMDGNALLPPPALKTLTIAQRAKHAEIQEALAAVDSQIASRRASAGPKLAEWEAAFLQETSLDPPPDDTLIHCPLDESEGTTVSTGAGLSGTVRGKAAWDAGRLAGGLRLDGQSHVDLGDRAGFERGDAFSATAWVYLDGDGAMTVLSRMNDEAGFRGYDLYLGDGQIFVHLIHHWPDNAIRVNSRDRIGKHKWHHIGFTYDGSNQAAGVNVYVDGERQQLERTHDRLTDTIRTDQPLRLGQRRAAAPWVGILDDVRIYARALDETQVRALAGADATSQLLAISPQDRSPAQTETLVDFFLARSDADYRRLIAERRELEARQRRLEGESPTTLVMQDMSQPRTAHVLIRGQYDHKGPSVEPDVPAMLPPLPDGAPANRLALARWLVAPEHPLTARVVANRFWQQCFGVGIVATAEDFGSQGEWPSHPQLLDWLAVEFQESGWDVKALQRLIVTSATYRQSSRVAPESARRDPQNRLLARGPRFRYDAEMIRDAALAISGLLVEQTGGKSVKPYQPGGLWEAVGYTSSNTARFQQDHGAALYRRSMYTFWKRTSPPPSMQILDAPSREVCTARRSRTNTPAAALVLMNDVQYVEAARNLAQRLCRLASPTDAARLKFGFRLATARQPEADELQVLRRLLEDYRREYAVDPEAAKALISQGESPWDPTLEPAELAAWTMVATTLLNLDETLTKE